MLERACEVCLTNEACDANDLVHTLDCGVGFVYMYNAWVASYTLVIKLRVARAFMHRSLSLFLFLSTSMDNKYQVRAREKGACIFGSINIDCLLHLFRPDIKSCVVARQAHELEKWLLMDLFIRGTPVKERERERALK